MAKRKQLINPHECNRSEPATFVVKRTECINEFGESLPFVMIMCEDCGERAWGATLRGASAKWNKEHPLPKVSKLRREVTKVEG